MKDDTSSALFNTILQVFTDTDLMIFYFWDIFHTQMIQIIKLILITQR